MTPREIRRLSEVLCPKGGGDCCTFMYYGRRLCSYPMDAHLEILVLVFKRLEKEHEERRSRYSVEDL